MRKGFTLAEVLITLGIIGVVAALVMPGLISDYRKREYVARLQKAVNVWNNGMALMLATDGVDYLNDTEFARAVINSGQNYFYSGDISAKPEIANILKKYFKIARFPNPGELYEIYKLGSGTLWAIATDPIYMADGSAYTTMNFQNLDSPQAENLRNGGVWIDVNGKRGPNRAGRDVFWFSINQYGQLVADHSQQSVDFGWIWNSKTWKEYADACGEEGSPDISGVVGYGCAARIIDEGWKMNY